MAGRVASVTRNWSSFLVLTAFVAALLPFETATILVCHADDQIDDDFTKEEATARQSPDTEKLFDRYSKLINDSFDEIVFDQKGPQVVNVAQTRLEAIAADQISAIDRLCELSREQKEKLERAARRDIRQFSNGLPPAN